jgi:peptidoglycan/xylan/chitin deacetylase (PgdA/CDA1 family)
VSAVVRGVTGPPGSRLARLLGAGLAPLAPLDGGAPPLERLVADLAAPAADLEAAGKGLPAGAGREEALALRLLAAGAELRWERPVAVTGAAALLRLCRERGGSSIELWRADPSLLCGLQLGRWFEAPWRTRLIRRIPAAAVVAARLALLSPRWLTLAGDLAFWAGARREASAAEWRRLTASSYVALVYHRFAGELKPGQERIDIAPRRFARQLRALRLAGWRALSPAQLLAFHGGADNDIPRRRFVITVDDAIADCVDPLARARAVSPQLFVPTAEPGHTAGWAGGEPVASWEQVRALAEAGVGVGSHTRHHRRLSELGPEEMRAELAGSLADLRERIPAPTEMLAYPNGDHDAAVCAATRAAGYRAAFTTEKGRNGAGTDVYRLRRVSVHGADGALAVLWKVATGEGLPGPWLGLRGPRRRPQRS